jgi:hypothetical protein
MESKTSGEPDALPPVSMAEEAKQRQFDKYVSTVMTQEKVVLRRLSLFETHDSFVLVGGNRSGKFFRIIKIGVEERRLVIEEDERVFTAAETRKYVSVLHASLDTKGGVRLVLRAEALLGLIKFVNNWYMVLVKEKQAVGLIGGRYIYAVKSSELFPLIPASRSKVKVTAEELKYKQYFQQVDMTTDFFFSYSYNLTEIVQTNFIRPPSDNAGDKKLQSVSKRFAYNDKFLWNYFWMREFLQFLDKSYWLVPLIHGFFEQKTVRFASKLFSVTLLARRSRHHAGTRYNKRGLSPTGHVANEVETEQIIALNKPWIEGRGGFSSYVMIRGSIPLFWKQANPWSPKPDITVYKTEEDYFTSRLHFDRLYAAYDAPAVCLNLIKKIEKRPQEVILGKEFEALITYLSTKCYGKPDCFQSPIQYMTYDFLNELKAKNDVTGDLYKIAGNLVDVTGRFSDSEFPVEFRSLDKEEVQNLQKGFVRINCVDCLDRTNIAMFCLGLSVFGHQLHDLGVIDSAESWERKFSGLAEVLQGMYTRHGDRIVRSYLISISERF